MALLLGLGAASGAAGPWALREPARPSEIACLQIEAATAYRVFAADEAHPAGAGPDDRAALARWMTRTLGRPALVPDLSAEGYRLLGGRTLTAMYGPAAMLTYEDPRSGRITLYVQPMRLGRVAGIQRVAAGAVDSFAWIAGRTGYSVLAPPGESGDALHGIASQLRDEMRL
ncbi:MAG: hypothetical protein JWP20_690 [Roseomonas sp.]|nr:hypothetical protein [Roseomonas sp.]